MGGPARLAGPRLTAAEFFRPSSPRWGSPEQAFSRIAMPWLLITGTKDSSDMVSIDAGSRRAVSPALPPGGESELVQYGASHSAFSDRPRPGAGESPPPNHHRSILAPSAASRDGYLRGKPLA